MTSRAPIHTRHAGRTALVLSGGGARGAYQVGVLRGLAQLGVIGPAPAPFAIFVGSSAGAINVGMLAAHADELLAGVERLARVWSTITPQKVFRTDIRSLGSIGARWAWDLSFGGALRRAQPKSLLDTAPLRTLLAEIPYARIEANVASGALYAAAVGATDLSSSNGHLFVHGHAAIQLWQRSRWRIERAALSVDHLMASSAIPIFFPPVKIGRRYFADGCMRNTAPLSPAINLGADRIVAIGVQGPGRPDPPAAKKLTPPTVAQIAGVLLDAVMLDSIETDVEHSARVNRSVLSCSADDGANPFRHVDVLWLSPSQDFGTIAAELTHRVPPILRYLMRGLGTDESITELLSYLLFDAAYTTRLIELGRDDAIAARHEIDRFFTADGRTPDHAATRHPTPPPR